MRLPLLLLTLLLSGCGAFADATDSDGGTPDAGITLKIRPQTIFQGQLNEYELTFTKGPPWIKEECGFTYVTVIDTGGTDVEYTTKAYQGETLIDATFRAKRNAAVGERIIKAEVACEKTGQPQRLHSERGRLYILEKEQLDGGGG